MRSVLTIGNFDGVHLGHQAIVREARRRADSGAARVVAVTFAAHPATVLSPGDEPLVLTDAAERAALLRCAGADEVVLLEPTREVLSLSPESFVRRMVEAYRPEAWVEGPDFRFGSGRAGDNALLASLGASLGFGLHVLPRQSVTLGDGAEVECRSSLVRELLAAGRVGDAAVCLDRPYALVGDVVRGEQRGRTIGYPTANLDPAALVGRVCPADGVYAGVASFGDGRACPAAISVGVKPTFGIQQCTIEAHLLNLAGDTDLYGRRMTLAFTRWVRGQEAFSSLDALVSQIERDVAQVRRWSNEPSASPGPVG